VDKNLRQHGLIKAFSRTNRVYSKEKEYGNIVCFRNIKSQVDEAVALFSNNTPNETVFAPDYKDLLEEFNKALQSLRSLTPTVQSVDMLMGNTKRTEFVKTFRKVLRQHNVLKTCTDFDYDHTAITEQELADYSSKYLDLRPSVNQYTEQKLRDSIVEDIDFEIELIPSELIDVDYIIQLLDRFVDPEETDTEKIKEKLLRELANNVKYHSKKHLIEKFIDEQLVNLDNPMSIKDRLGMFITDEREKALHELSSQYGIAADELGSIIEDTVWRRVDIISEDLSPLLLDKYKFQERKQIVNKLFNSVNEYSELYYKGW
jgi:type I restriction enzyme R subunit